MKDLKEIALKIIDYDHRGRGIGKIDGLVVFVKGGVLGDKVNCKITKVKKRYLEGEVAEVLSPSSLRQPSPCPYSDRCGGCDFLDLDYRAELAWKKQSVEEQIKRIGELDPRVQETLGMESPYAYRNHMQFHVEDRKIGLYEKGSRDLVQIKRCLKQSEVANELLASLQDQRFLDGIRTVGIRTNQSNEIMLIVTSLKKLSQNQRDKLIGHCLDYNVKSIYETVSKNRRFHYGRDFELIYGEPYLNETFLTVDFFISPDSFFQVNYAQAKNLTQLAIQPFIEKGSNLVLDLYCGIGTMSLPMAKSDINVIGIELNQSAIEDARDNAENNRLRRARFVSGRTEEKLERLIDEEQIKPDGLLLDPPRSGADKKVIKEILELEPEVISYVSCNPSTLARDLHLLREKYHILSVTPVDMFSRTAHVESVAKLILNK